MFYSSIQPEQESKIAQNVTKNISFTPGGMAGLVLCLFAKMQERIDNSKGMGTRQVRLLPVFKLDDACLHSVVHEARMMIFLPFNLLYLTAAWCRGG